MKPLKNNKILVVLAIFVIACLFISGNNTSKVSGYDLNLNSGVVISFIKANNNVNTIAQDKNATNGETIFAINESRVSSTLDDNSVSSANINFLAKSHNTYNWRYIKNYSYGIVIHPPLSQLGVLII